MIGPWLWLPSQTNQSSPIGPWLWHLYGEIGPVEVSPVVIPPPGGGPALPWPYRPYKKKKKKLEEILSGLRPVIERVKQESPKVEIDAASIRAVRRAQLQNKLAAFAERIDAILAQRSEYDRDVVLAAIATRRIIQMEEEETIAILLLDY